MQTKPNIIIICLDLGRPDYLGCYGFSKNTSPNIDRLAHNGVLFESVTSTAPWTIPSHASMFTGLYPHQHQANWQTFRIKPGVQTIFDLLTGQGYESVAVTANTLLVAPCNMFGPQTKVLNPVRRKHPEVSVFVDEFDENSTNARAIADIFIGFLKNASQTQPFLAYLNFYDLHSKYSAPEPFFSEFVSPAAQQQLKNIGDLYNLHFKEMNHQVVITREMVAVLRDFYCAKLKMIDHYLGDIFNTLQEKKLWDNTCLVITSDHGDILGDHRYPSFHHQFNIYNSVLNVPLLWHYPDFIRQAKRVNVPLVQNIDIAPTILEIGGLSKNQLLRDTPGRSLVDYFSRDSAKGDDSLRSFAIAQTDSLDIFLKRVKKEVNPAHVKNLYAIQNEKYKLIFSDLKDFRELYDLRKDKTEQDNIAGKHPDKVEFFKNMFLKLTQAASPLTETGKDAVNFDEQTAALLKKRLKTLGYLE